MNKVYVLWRVPEYEENSIIGIFKTKEGAEKYRDEMIQEMYEDHIEESDQVEYYLDSYYLSE